MSDYAVIEEVSKALLAILKKHITDHADAQLNGVNVDLRSPKEMREPPRGSRSISLWLYQVARNEHMLNQAPQRVAPNQVLSHPLPINLYYLVTPFLTDPGNEQVLLGRVLQTFNDHSILHGSDLPDSLQGSVKELRLTLQPLTLEELTRIWHSMQESYQLSVTYRVQVVAIDSDHEPVQTEPVLTKVTGYTQFTESG